MGLPNKAKKAFDKVVEWDRKCAKKIQDKFNLTDDTSLSSIRVLAIIILGTIWFALLFDTIMNNERN